MRVVVERIYTCPTYTIGHLYINGMYICDTIEDTDRGLSNAMTEDRIKKLKVYGKTAIPYGTYNLTMNVRSAKFSVKDYYKRICDGYLPRIQNVKGFEGILIHVGNTADDSYGCVLVGYNTVKGKVMRSKEAFEKIMTKYFLPAKKSGEKITITIREVYK